MRRLALTAAIAVLAAVLAGAALAAPQLARTKVAVRVKSCSLADHSAVFYARMKKVPGTTRMRLRFALLERLDGVGPFAPVRAPELAAWRKSNLRVRAFGYSQEVRGLHDGAAYRVRVRYRWFGKDHTLLRATRRTSRVCRMFIPLPNLQVKAVDAGSIGGGVWRYRVRVFNTGHVPARDVTVQLSVDGGVVDSDTVGYIAPGDSRRIPIDGPPCRNDYSFVADPANDASETNEADNSDTASCLAAG